MERYVVVNVWQEIEYSTSNRDDAFDRLEHLNNERLRTDGPFTVFRLEEVQQDGY